MQGEVSLLFGCLSRLFSGPATCPPELTPGDSPIDSLEMSIGDLEQKEFAKGEGGRGECRAFLSRVGRVRIHLHRYAYVARMRLAGPWSDFLRPRFGDRPANSRTKTISPGDEGDLISSVSSSNIRI